MTKEELIEDKLVAFAEKLVNHDFLYSYSDDHSVYMKGVKAEEELEKMIKELGDYDEQFELLARDLYKSVYEAKHPSLSVH